MSDPIGRMYARQVAALAAIAGPVVPPRSRVSEHTDSARLEATRDAIRTGTAPRPRVEGEAVRRPLDRTLVRLYAEFTDAECAAHGDAGVVIRDLALNLLDADASVGGLTVEVERLTPPAHERYVRFSTELAEQMRDWSEPVRLKVEDGPDGFLVLTAKFVNALPTPAPEAKE